MCQQHVWPLLQLHSSGIAPLDRRKLGDPQQLGQDYLQGVGVRDHHISKCENDELLRSLLLGANWFNFKTTSG